MDEKIAFTISGNLPKEMTLLSLINQPSYSFDNYFSLARRRARGSGGYGGRGQLAFGRVQVAAFHLPLSTYRYPSFS
jgi:hypothetical protein